MDPIFIALIALGAYLLIGFLLVGGFQFQVKLPMGKFLWAMITWPRVFIPRRKDPETRRE